MINNVSGSESTEENKKYTRYTDIYYYYYWTITTQSTSYTWTITGTYINGDSAGALTNYSKTTDRYSNGVLLCTISYNTTYYTYTGTLSYQYIVINRWTLYYTSASGSTNNKYYGHLNPLTMYRTIDTYGWG